LESVVGLAVDVVEVLGRDNEGGGENVFNDPDASGTDNVSSFVIHCFDYMV
jgi:hypothetical protein